MNIIKQEAAELVSSFTPRHFNAVQTALRLKRQPKLRNYKQKETRQSPRTHKNGLLYVYCYEGNLAQFPR